MAELIKSISTSMKLYAFFISNTFKQNLSKISRLNFCFLKIIHFLYP